MAFKCRDCKHTNVQYFDHNDPVTIVGYGECPNCTPQELFEAESDYTDARIDQGKIYDAKMLKKRNTFINLKTEQNRKRIAEIFNANKPAHVAEIDADDLIPKLS